MNRQLVTVPVEVTETVTAADRCELRYRVPVTRGRPGGSYG
jgi:hypothetical protein